MPLVLLIFFFLTRLKTSYIRGQLDDSRPGNGLPVDGADLLHAVQCMIETKEIAPTKTEYRL